MPADESNLLRVTIKDPEQTISFRASPETAQRLIAGCAGSPARVGELLAATDIYDRGLANRVVSELMEFDKTMQREGLAAVVSAFRLAQENGLPVEYAFQVLDEVTERAAFTPGLEPVVIFDLVERSLRITAGLDLKTSGDVRIREGGGVTDRTVTFLLPPGWKIETL